MIELYDSKFSGNAWKVRLLLSHLGIAFERRTLALAQGDARTPQFLAMNPLARVPVVRLDDGRALFESDAILAYFADGTPLLPADRYERAQTMAWLFFEQYDHVRFFARPRFLVTITRSQPADSPEVLALRETGTKALDAMERHLAERDWFAAGRFTVADIALYPYTSLADEGGYSLARYPAIRRWLERVRAQPGYQPLL